MSHIPNNGSMDSNASSESDALPVVVSNLLKQISAECARVDGWITSTEQKQAVQAKVREHAKERAQRGEINFTTNAAASITTTQPSRASSTASSTAASSLSNPSFSLHVTPPEEDEPPATSALVAERLAALSLTTVPPFETSSSSSSALTDSLPPPQSPLFRQLSEAAQAGIISHEFKQELKDMLLNNRISGLSTTRLVRSVTEEGELIVTKQKLDLSGIDEDACVQYQLEERDAIQAIYDELVTFNVSTEVVDGDEKEDEDEGDEVKEGDEEEDGSGDLESQECINVIVKILPYPGSSKAENPISATVQFTLPPLYPYIRPSFKVLSVEGNMAGADSMMIGTAINEELNSIYVQEPVPEADVRVVLFDLINAAQTFLVEYVDYLNDKVYHDNLAAEKAAREKAERYENEKRDYEIRHAQEVLAYYQSDHKKLEFKDYTTSSKVQSDPVLEAARLERKRKEEAEAKRALEAKLAAEALAKKLREEQEAREREIFLKAMDQQAPKNAHSSAFNAICPKPSDIVEYLRTKDVNFPRHYLSQFSTGHLWMEDITSPFLVYRFMKKREAMASVGKIITASIAFHGTLPAYVDSIRNNGLVVPGQKISSTGTTLAHRCDTGYFGKGIYLAPNASYSLGYGSFNNLFVCLVLRGKSHEQVYDLGCGLKEGFDSHHSAGGGHEWIIFDSAAVLPIYLMKGTPHNNAPGTAAPPPPPVSKTIKLKKATHAVKPPLASKSAKLLLAQIQREQAAAKSGTKKGPVSHVPGKKKKVDI